MASGVCMNDFENKIICGDCLEVMKGWPDDCVDLVVTSPPYNLVREYTGGGPRSGRQYKTHIQRQYRWYADNMPEDEYLEWQKCVVRRLHNICRGSVFYNNKLRYALKRRGMTYHPYEIVKGLPLWTEIIWNRGVSGAGNWPRWCPQEERIYQIGRPVTWNGYDGGNIWNIRPSINNNGHPATFPIEIPKRCILACTHPGHIILDPFCGSGTTCLAARKLGRRYIGIDISPEYCKVAEERIRAVDTGVPFEEARAGQKALFE